MLLGHRQIRLILDVVHDDKLVLLALLRFVHFVLTIAWLLRLAVLLLGRRHQWACDHSRRSSALLWSIPWTLARGA